MCSNLRGKWHYNFLPENWGKVMYVLKTASLYSTWCLNVMLDPTKIVTLMQISEFSSRQFSTISQKS